MRTDFVKGVPSEANFAPFAHLPNHVPLDKGAKASVRALNSCVRQVLQIDHGLG
jgi:hypothetical protein